MAKRCIIIKIFCMCGFRFTYFMNRLRPQLPCLLVRSCISICHTLILMGQIANKIVCFNIYLTTLPYCIIIYQTIFIKGIHEGVFVFGNSKVEQPGAGFTPGLNFILFISFNCRGEIKSLQVQCTSNISQSRLLLILKFLSILLITLRICVLKLSQETDFFILASKGKAEIWLDANFFIEKIWN